MKRTVKVLAIALLGMALASACKEAPAEQNNDSIPPVEDSSAILAETPDSLVDEQPVVVEEKAPAKKAAAKQEVKETPKPDASKVTITTDQGSASFGKNGATVKSNENKPDASKVTISTNQGSASFGKSGVQVNKN